MGHYQRHLDAVLQLRAIDKRNYDLAVPGHRPHDQTRTLHQLPVVPIHECIEEELHDDPTILEQLDRSVRDRTWPPSYFDNPIVQTEGDSPLPIAMFVDGVPYSNLDGVLGFWFINLISGTRHLAVCMRKRNMCKCGCKGIYDSM